MKKLINLSIAVLTIGFASSTCAAAVGPFNIDNNAPTGLILNNTSMGTSATNNVTAKKEGRSCSITVLGLFAIGNATVDKAKEDAKITKVASVDNTAFNVLSVYGHYCTVVRGE